MQNPFSLRHPHLGFHHAMRCFSHAQAIRLELTPGSQGCDTEVVSAALQKFRWNEGLSDDSTCTVTAVIRH
jgi:hypothetical protein